MQLNKLKNFFRSFRHHHSLEVENPLSGKDSHLQGSEGIEERTHASVEAVDEDLSKNKIKENIMSNQIYVEPTPNPNALKFIFPGLVIKEGKVTFTNKNEVPNVPLLSALFDIGGVEQLHLFENVITVTKDGSRDWEVVEPEVKEACDHMVDSHDPGFEIASSKKVISYESLSPDLKEINEILDRTIRPGLQSDGGDLEVVELKDDKQLIIRYEGACGSCPSSTSGTMYAIEGILKDEFHPDITVVAV